jgi:putative FmdB family regulatory protein
VPTYQYSCTECGHFFEQFQSFSEDSLTTCPQCEGRLRKVFNAVGVVFKGSGFYRTDSRSASSGDGASSTSSTSSDKPAAKSESTGGSKSDSSSSTSTSAGSGSGSTSGSKAGSAA